MGLQPEPLLSGTAKYPHSPDACSNAPPLADASATKLAAS